MDTERKLAKLAALEAGGVDNWEYYDTSLEEWHREGEVEDLLEETLEHLQNCLVDSISHEYPAGQGCGASYIVDADTQFADVLREFSENLLGIERNK